MKVLHSRRKFVSDSATFLSAGSLLSFSDLMFNHNGIEREKGIFMNEQNIIGAYGPWVNDLTSEGPRRLSFRSEIYKSVPEWKPNALTRINECLAKPDFGNPHLEVQVEKIHSYDGLHIEDLTWQLPYGAPTRAYLLKPEGNTERLPGILAFHDHGGNKYFGRRKITRVSDDQHPLMIEHQRDYYSGRAWANELAKLGYVVLVSDAFTFASRRVLLNEVPRQIRRGLDDENPEDIDNIKAYNDWAANHEHIMAKSLFCGGTCWPAIFLSEDQMALDILCNREDVDATKVGCAGLSGGGLRTVFTGGLDERIRCAVCVGFMSTWSDFLLNKSYTHTWMTYVPLIANDLDFPEIFGMRVPLPTLVLNDSDDQLYTLPEMQNADKILGEVYAKAGAPENYKASFYPGPHKFDAEMQKEAFDWFDQWLK